MAFNAGVRGHATLDSINALTNRFSDSDAKIVLLMHNINDRLLLAIQGNDAAKLGYQPPTSARAVKNSFLGFTNSVWEYALYRSNILFTLRFGVRLSSAWRDENSIGEVTERSIEYADLELDKHRPKFEKPAGLHSDNKGSREITNSDDAGDRS